jgi:hypothetical protein
MEFDHFSASLPITLIFFPWKNFRRCGQRREKTRTDSFFASFLPTMRQNDRHCRQQRGTLFRVVGNKKAEKCSAL